ncbi:MAG: efflux RND transporter periplasmic adaptor subunit [Gammaproteobacteria bacterium]
MSRTKPIALLAAALVAGAAGGYWIARHPSPQLDSSAKSAAGAAAGERKVLYWHDPMKPNARFDKPGKSPFMDMQLVPVYADEAPSGGAVRVGPNVAQSLGIRLGRVSKETLPSRLTAVGSVAFDENSVEVVQARVEGYVARLHVKALLSRVKRGEPVVEIVSPGWRSAQEEYIALLDSQSERGQSIRDAARQRLLVLGVPESVVRDIEARRQVRATTTLVAPRDGVVTELSVRQGSAFMPGAPLFRLNGLDRVWVVAHVPEAQVSLVPLGSQVTVRATAWPAESFKGRAVALLPDVDAQSRTLPVRIEVQNVGQRLAPGMFVSLEFAGPQGDPQLVVPSEAVIMTGERAVVIVAREQGGFDVVDVKAGTEVGGKTAILSGLEESQSIVVSGQFLIDSEASLRATVARLGADGETEHGAPKASEPRP